MKNCYIMSLSLLSKSSISEEELKDITLYNKSLPICEIYDVPSFTGLAHKFSEHGPTCDQHTVEDVGNEYPKSDLRKSFYGIEISNQCQTTNDLTEYIRKNNILKPYSLDAFSISSAYSNSNNFSVLPENDAACCSKHSEVSMQYELRDLPKKLNMLPMSCNITNKVEYDNQESKTNIFDACDAKNAIYNHNLDEDNIHSNIVSEGKYNLILSNKGEEAESTFNNHLDGLNGNTSGAKEGKKAVYCSNSLLIDTSKCIELEESNDEITYILLSSDDSDTDETTEIMRESFKNMSVLEYEDLTPIDKNTMEDSFKNSLLFSLGEMESKVKSSTPLKNLLQLCSSNKKFLNGTSDSIICTNDNSQAVDDSSILFVEKIMPLDNFIKHPIRSDSEIMTADKITSPRNLGIIQNDRHAASMLIEQNLDGDSAQLSNIDSQFEEKQELVCISIEVDHSISFDLSIEIDDKEHVQPWNMIQDAMLTLTSSNHNDDCVNKNQTKSKTNSGLAIKEEFKEESLTDDFNKLHGSGLNISFHSLSLGQNLVNNSSNEISCNQSSRLKTENGLSEMQPDTTHQNIEESSTLHLDQGSKNSCESTLPQSPITGTSSINNLHQINENNNASDEEVSLADEEFSDLFLSDSNWSLYSDNENFHATEALNENVDELENISLISEKDHKQPNIIRSVENVCNAENIGYSVIQEDVILKENEVQRKSYHDPFVSTNEKENKDNNDPEWEFLKKLRSDEQRYRVVRNQWKNLTVPDPNVNLTQYSFRWKRNIKNHSESSDSCNASKRKRDDSDTEKLHSSKRRKFHNIKFNEDAINNTEMILNKEFDAKRRETKSFQIFRQIKGRYIEYKEQFNFAKEEAAAMFRFYQGLPNQTIVKQETIEKEHRDIEYLYELFRRYYNWDGAVFNPVIKSGRTFCSRYRR